MLMRTRSLLGQCLLKTQLTACSASRVVTNSDFQYIFCIISSIIFSLFSCDFCWIRMKNCSVSRNLLWFLMHLLQLENEDVVMFVLHLRVVMWWWRNKLQVAQLIDDSFAIVTLNLSLSLELDDKAESRIVQNLMTWQKVTSFLSITSLSSSHMNSNLLPYTVSMGLVACLYFIAQQGTIIFSLLFNSEKLGCSPMWRGQCILNLIYQYSLLLANTALQEQKYGKHLKAQAHSTHSSDCNPYFRQYPIVPTITHSSDCNP